MKLSRDIQRKDMKNLLVNIHDYIHSPYYPLMHYDYFDLLPELEKQCKQASVRQTSVGKLAIRVTSFTGGVTTISELVWKVIRHMRIVYRRYFEDVGFAEYHRAFLPLGAKRRAYIVKVIVGKTTLLKKDREMISLDDVCNTLETLETELPGKVEINIEVHEKLYWMK